MIGYIDWVWTLPSFLVSLISGFWEPGNERRPLKTWKCLVCFADVLIHHDYYQQPLLRTRNFGRDGRYFLLKWFTENHTYTHWVKENACRHRRLYQLDAITLLRKKEGYHWRSNISWRSIENACRALISTRLGSRLFPSLSLNKVFNVCNAFSLTGKTSSYIYLNSRAVLLAYFGY